MGRAKMYSLLHLFRNDDLKALGVDDSKKLTEEQREELLQKVNLHLFFIL